MASMMTSGQSLHSTSLTNPATLLLDGKSLATLLPEVEKVVIKAAEFIAREAATFSTDKVEYKGTNDLVSYVDRETERLLVHGLSAVLPSAAFITEEGTVEQWQAGQQADQASWIIDPLDGTTNFTHGLPPYAVSVGLAYQGKMVLGVVCEVTRMEVFAAALGHGATRNGNPLVMPAVQELKHSLLATGFPYNNFWGVNQYLDILHQLMKECHGLRRMGSASVDLCYVAAGRFQGFFEYNLSAWDVAAGALIVQEAGGTVTDFKGYDNWLFGRQIIAAGPIHSAMQAIISQHWKELGQ